MRKPFTIRYSLFAICLLFAIRCLLFTICYLLFAIRCLYSSPFLKLPTGARGLALSGSYVAGEDLSVVEYNPAGLMTYRGLNAEFSYMRHLEETTINSLYGGYTSRKFALAFGYKGYSADDTARDTLGAEAGKITHSESVISGAVGLTMARNFSAGLNVRLLSRKISDSSIGGISTSLSGIIFDVGFMYLRGADSYGVSITNIGSGMKFDYIGAVPEAPPLTYSLGGRHSIGRISGLWQISKLNDNKRLLISTALEYHIIEHLALRGGIKYLKAFDVSLGAGFRWNKFHIDYALSPHVDFGAVHNISVGVRF